MAQKYRGIRVTEEAHAALLAYIEKTTPKPPARPPTLSSAILALVSKVR